MRRRFAAMMASAAVASALQLPQSDAALAAIGEAISDPRLDPAACLAAVAGRADSDRIIADCGRIIDNEKASPADRLKALLARAGAYVSTQQDDRAIADYDVALKLDPSLADI